MKLQICTREEAEHLPGRQDWAVICISDPLYDEVALMPGWHAVHQMRCEGTPDLHIMITEENARSLVLFVYKHSDLEGFIVYCNKNIGRTQGVAAWISEHFSIPEFALTNKGSEFALDPRFNQHIYGMLTRHDNAIS
jgi:hypothetical protein